MKKQEARRKAILEIIRENEIDTQESLSKYLNEMGYKATQTTVSRDMKQLNIVKSSTGKGCYKFAVSENIGNRPIINSIVSDSVVEIERAQNIIVIKTRAGMANAVAVCVESAEMSHIVGTIAGDDTIFIVVKDNGAAIKSEGELKEIFGIK